MKRSIIIGILSIIGSFVPSITLAANVSHTDSVSLLVMDKTKLLVKADSSTSILKQWWGNSGKKNSTSTVTKAVTPKVVEKTNTKQIQTTLEEFKTLKKATLPNMVKTWGYNWKTDRAKLANEVGIPHYVGTMQQNTQIKNYLLSKIEIKGRKVADKVPDLPKTSKQTKDMEKQPLFVYAKNRGYIREIDKAQLAKEAGIKDYVGNKGQNLLIKKYLRSKVKIE